MRISTNLFWLTIVFVLNLEFLPIVICEITLFFTMSLMISQPGACQVKWVALKQVIKYSSLRPYMSKSMEINNFKVKLLNPKKKVSNR